jgi:glycerol transport system substrate-binding protein
MNFSLKNKIAALFILNAILAFLLFSSCKGEEPVVIDPVVGKWSLIFNPSVLTKNEIITELTWFRDAAVNLRGETILSAAEDIETHYWESRVLANAFFELTGIKVVHDIIPEGLLVDRLRAQIENKKYYYDIYVNDSDLIGWHLRTGAILNLSDYMAKDGKKFTNPGLDLNDFLNIEFGCDYDGNILQLPDQQFVNLYWFRYDWFSREDLREKFKFKYGYDLGVPVNWAAYEDIAEFFTTTPVDGKKVYGHLDYGKTSAALGWRFTDAWLSIAGVGDTGLPNGIPVDEWGIRVENRIPVGSSVSRGGEVNGPASVYALEKYLEWLKKYAPGEARKWEWADSGTVSSRGDIAQQIFQYVTWLSDPRYHTAGSPVCDRFGKPLWRVAPTPLGRYWDKGMKIGYQDQGSWTIPVSTRGDKRAASWLWAQFCVSKSVTLKKFLIGGTPIRKSTIFSDYLTEHIDEYGGIIEFYRSSDEKKWTGSSRNVPYYPGMSQLWWKNIAKAITGKYTAQQAMDTLAEQQDSMMANLKLKSYRPKLNKKTTGNYWLNRPGKLTSESPKEYRPRPRPVTVQYEVLLKQWENKGVR